MTPPHDRSQAATRPDAVGGYRLKRELSRGPVGTLHESRGRGGEWVLVRLVSPELTAEQRAVVDRDLSVLEAVFDPHVASVVARGDGHYVLKAPGGVSLLNLIRRHRPLDERELVWVGAAVADGLAALHTVGLPHGDLLPTTVAVTPYGPMLLDLGWRRRLNLDTPPPEQVEDLRALGEMLAFSASGVRPPPEATGRDLRQRIPWLSSDVSELIQLLLGPPDTRPTAARVADELGDLAHRRGAELDQPLASLEGILSNYPDRTGRRRSESGSDHPTVVSASDRGRTDVGSADATRGFSDTRSGSHDSGSGESDVELIPKSKVLLRPGLELSCERLLGEGGMGRVYLLRDPRLGRLSALKLVKGGGPTSTRVRRFRRETSVTARLDHPGIPPVYEAGQTPEGRDYLLMRYVEGSSLKELLERRAGKKKPSVQETRQLLDAMVKVGEALAYAHSRGIVHRDLKPANLMIGSFGEAFVMDWGLARDLRESSAEDEEVRELATVLEATRNLTHDGAFLGTPGYMAPEQVRREEVDGRADLFAFGAILTEILTGEPPFAGLDTVELMAQTSEGLVELPSERDKSVSPELNAIVEKALAGNVAYRYRSAEALVADLKAYLEGRPVSVYHYGSWERFRRTFRAHRTLFTALTVIVILLLGAAALVTRATTEALAARREAAETKLEVGRRAVAEEAKNRQEVADLLGQGQQALKEDRPDLAQDYFVKVLALDAKRLEAQVGKLEAERLLAKRREAAIVTRDQTSAARLTKAGQAALQKGRLEEARQAFVQALGFDGKGAAAQAGLVEADRRAREREQRRARNKARAELVRRVERARRFWGEGRKLYTAQEDPALVQEAYLKALDQLGKALALEPNNARAARIRAKVAAELFWVLDDEGQTDMAEFVLRTHRVERPKRATLEIKRDPNLIVVETDRVVIRRAFGGVVHFAPSRAFDALRRWVRQAGGGDRFQVTIDVRSRLTPTIPPQVLVAGLRIRVEDKTTRGVSPPKTFAFDETHVRNVRLDKHRRLVAPIESASTLPLAEHVRDVSEHVKQVINAWIARDKKR